MAYSAIVDMARSRSLAARIAAAAALEQVDEPELWANQNMWALAATPGWADDWGYAVDTASINVNPDTGARDDVINDAKILSAVQALIAAQAGGTA